MLNRQHSSENINISLKLYRSILSKSQYASLELAALWLAALRPEIEPIANFLTHNLVKVGSRDNNKEQCHRFWQCQYS